MLHSLGFALSTILYFTAVPAAHDTGLIACDASRFGNFRAPEPRTDPIVRLSRSTVQIDPAVDLFRVTSAFYTDGDILGVTNAGNQEILLFGEHGSLVRRVGSSGSGPGEFRTLFFAHYRRSNRTISAYDAATRSVTQFDLEGTFLGLVRLQSPGLFTLYDVQPVGGSDYVALTTWSVGGTAKGLSAGLHTAEVPIVRLNDRGILEGTIGNVRGVERIVVSESERIAVFDRPLATQPWILVGPGSCIVHPWLEGAGVTVRGQDGTVQAQIDLAFVDVSIDERAWSTRVRALASSGHDFPSIPVPEFRPAWSNGIWDGDNRIWLEEYHVRDENTRGWWVLDLAQGSVGFVEAPENTRRLLAAARDRAAILNVDVSGVEQVVLYDLR